MTSDAGDGNVLLNYVGGLQWYGTARNVAIRLVGGRTGRQLPQIGLSTCFRREAAKQSARNLDEQERASGVTIGRIGIPSAEPVPCNMSVGDREDELHPLAES